MTTEITSTQKICVSQVVTFEEFKTFILSNFGGQETKKLGVNGWRFHNYTVGAGYGQSGYYAFKNYEGGGRITFDLNGFQYNCRGLGDNLSRSELVNAFGKIQTCTGTLLGARKNEYEELTRNGGFETNRDRILQLTRELFDT
jgi:hypothetical protein